jgi:asparaginyl-tRNA synthetase
MFTFLASRVVVELWVCQANGFCYTHTPIITSNDCEGAGEAFRLAPVASSTDPPGEFEFFSKPSYLTVSSQLHLEALSSAISRVYTVSPCFRAERSQTGRHLAEFWMLEAEWAYIREVGDVCRVVEASVKDVLRERNTEDMLVLWKGKDEAKLKALEDASRLEGSWTRMTYAEAIGELSKHEPEFQYKVAWGTALQSEHEKWLSEKITGGPVFVTDYPAALKPFYMRRNDDGRTVACFDLLIPYVGELAGGSLREERVGILEESLVTHGLEKSEYEWYADLRRYGGAPHGGFGLGLERLIGWISGIDNIRECIAMPRWAGRMLL